MNLKVRECLSLYDTQTPLFFHHFETKKKETDEDEDEEEMFIQSEINGVSTPPPATSPTFSTPEAKSPLNNNSDLLCQCGGGICTVRTSGTIKNPNRKFYCCPGKTGRDCGFFKWCDMVTINGVSTPPPAPSPTFSTPEAKSSMNNNSDHPSVLLCQCGVGVCTVRTSGTVENPNRKFYCCPGKTERCCGFFEWCDEVTMDKINNPVQYRFPDCDCGAGICHLRFMKYGPFAGQKCFVCPIRKGDGACSFVQVLDTQGERETAAVNSSSSPSTGGVVQEPPSSNGIGGGSAVSDAFVYAALHLQNGLLNQLESMDPLDHEKMVIDANSVFTALDHFKVEYRSFRDRVEAFIDCASSLAGRDDDDKKTIEKLDHQYKCEKMNFDDLCRKHAEAMADFTASHERLQSFHEEVSRIKDMLYHVENQLSSCEEETMDHQNRLGEISEAKLVSEQSLHAAGQEVEELHKQRGVNRIMAKAALEQAKAQLRQ